MERTMTEKVDSPLGDKSMLYLEKTKSRGSIQDHPDEGYIEFYPSGYSHSSRRDNENRQVVQQAIYQAAVSYHTEAQEFPFEKIDHSVYLLPDVENPVDPNAMWVILDAPNLRNCHNRDIGFVPAEIAQALKENINRITAGRIYKVRADWHKKFYTCKVVLYYGKIPVTDDPSLGRFADIIMEG